MTELADPRASQLVLIGTATYTYLDALPAVAANLEAMAETLGRADLWGIPPENRHVLLDVPDPRAVGRAVRKAANSVGMDGLLLVYYAGHGLIDPNDGTLILAL